MNKRMTTQTGSSSPASGFALPIIIRAAASPTTQGPSPSAIYERMLLPRFRCRSACCRGEDAGRVVVRVAVRRRARRLERLGIVRRLARGRVPEHAAAAVLVGVEHVARAPARHRLPVDPDGQLRGAGPSQVAVAAGGAAVAALRIDRRHHHRQVEAVDEADVVEVQGGEGELGERGGRLPRAGAFEGGAAAAGLARPVPVPVEVASGPAPDPAGPPDRGLEDDGLALLQSEPTAVEAVARYDPRPYRGLALVHYSEDSRSLGRFCPCQQKNSRKCSSVRDGMFQ
ncbi:hypothetical protein MUK42_37485 [Musa troglodytarum]|uniref:Uncharacterized protein n=1 Tax=Musa troglodytarum TaxID=320322 RepID=A0A9E7I2X0_9LILI|nr:hypothetical protein MUK42_37485 [Musa troglodytarum]URE41657.1 hypothetical protein MUK42_37485 [Musa troglodytarum]